MSTAAQKYPPLNEYNSAVQHPRVAFSNLDLKNGQVETTGLGLPRALGGGFAITYTIDVGNKKYAVRCFHKSAPDLEQKYRRISSALSADRSGYFVGFDYEPNGDKSYAHGDLQNGNVIVNGNAKLIDYDGFYVPGLSVGQGAELGHKHFQHPARSFADFGPQMDRFSFIVIDLSLHAAIEIPSLFQKYSNGENIIFCASDFKNPSQSGVFQDLFNNSSFKNDALSFARVCTAPIKDVPTLGDFLAGRNIPANVILISSPPEGQVNPPSAYIGAFDVIDGSNFVGLGSRVGDRVELVGRIVEVRKGTTRHRKPYIFLNFGDWRSNQTKVNIWSEGLSILTQTPDASWQGKWISVTGLVDPPYKNRKIGYTHLSITVTEANQIRRIDEFEARRRLSASKNGTNSAPSANSAILRGLNPQSPQIIPGRVGGQTITPPGVGSNQQILTTLQGQATSAPKFTQSQQAPSSKVSPAPSGQLIKWGVAAAVAYVLYLLLKNLATPNPTPAPYTRPLTSSGGDWTTVDRNPIAPSGNSTITSRVGSGKSTSTAPKSAPTTPWTPLETPPSPAGKATPSLVPQGPSPQLTPQPNTPTASWEAPPLPPPINIWPSPSITGSAAPGSATSTLRPPLLHL